MSNVHLTLVKKKASYDTRIKTKEFNWTVYGYIEDDFHFNISMKSHAYYEHII